MSCGSFVSKFWNRQNAFTVPDSEIRTSLHIHYSRNNRYRRQKAYVINELRNVSDVSLFRVLFVVTIIRFLSLTEVVSILYKAQRQNAQAAEQHMCAVVAWAFISV